MVNFVKRAIRFIRARYAPRGARLSFAGSGEDLIIADLFKHLGVKKPTYIDIGAYHPVYGSNTYYFYRLGSRGVLVEPNSQMCLKSRSARPRDVCIDAGVGRDDGSIDFYSFTRDTRNTFSKEEALSWQKTSGEVPTISKKKVVSINKLINDFFPDSSPDLVSIDTEGYELEILNGFDWSSMPKVFCIETVSSSGINNDEVSVLMGKHGYRLVGKTKVNEIYAI